MAQDFRAAFGLGEDEKHISTLDEGGVALAAVQEGGTGSKCVIFYSKDTGKNLLFQSILVQAQALQILASN